MKYIARQQIKGLFDNPQKIMEEGLWYSGYEGDGEYKEWFNNGQLFKHCFYKNGNRDGEYKMWFNNGRLEYHQLYKDGKLVKDYLE